MGNYGFLFEPLLKYKHKKCGTEHEISWSDFYNGDRGCPKCGKEKASKKKRKNFQDIVNIFKQLDFILLTKEEEYKDNKTKLKCIDKYGEINFISFASLRKRIKRMNDKINK